MSDGPTELEKRIELFEELLKEMRQETREAHSVLKQIRIERREIENHLLRDTKKMVEQRTDEVVKTELDKIGPQVREQTNLIYAKVGQQIDMLIDLSLGKAFSNIHNREDIRPQLAKKLRQWIREILDEEGYASRGDN